MEELMDMDMTDYLFFLVIILAAGIGMSSAFVPYMVSFLAGCLVALTWCAYKRTLFVRRNI